MKHLTREIVITVLIALVIFLAVHFTLQSFKVKGDSMLPSLQSGQYLLINKVVYSFSSQHRGEVVVFHPPVNSEDVYIKRIIGLPGETIEITRGKVYINGEPLDEPYIEEEAVYDYPPYLIPPGHYFVLGDNRNGSSDSRRWGPVPEENIIGKAWLCYWPPGDWEIVPSYSLATN